MTSKTLTIVALGAAGDGVAPLPDGGTCFVPLALPGETVRLERQGNRARLLEVLTSSPDRVTPPCPHFTVCGGCALQHWAEAPYAAWKSAKLAEALSRAGYPDAPLAPLVRTPLRHRRRADLALRRTPAGVALGFHARGSAQVVTLDACEVLDARLVALFAPLREMLRRLNALQREGSAVLNLLDSGPDLLLRTDGALDQHGRALLAGFAEAHGLPRITWARGNGPPETAAQFGPAFIMLGGVRVQPPPGAFLQASPAGEAAIIAAVLAALPAKLSPKARIAELYAGIGTLSFPLSQRARVNAFEGAPDAVAALQAVAGGHRIQAEKRDLARRPLLPAELKPFEVVVLDPPFAGAADQVAQLARARVPRVIYVSCNPAALGRDAAMLRQAGYRLLAATPIDQFHFSPHLEAVVSFAL
jgi:23S rRNA (uracil1939-C5)-methyltransferase